MALSDQFWETLEKALQIDKFKKFIRTKKSIKNGEELWLLKKEELDQKEYMNAWELILAESLFITLISTFFIYALQLFTNEKATLALDMYISSSKFGYFTPLISLLIIAATIYFLSKLVIPKKHKKSNDKTGLVVLIYYLGAKGFVVGLLTVISLSLLIAIGNSTGIGGLKGFLIYLFIFISVCLVWTYTLTFFAIAKGRSYYEPHLKLYTLLVKYLIFLIVATLTNSILMGIIFNYEVIIEFIGIERLPPKDQIIPAIYSYIESMDNEEYILFIQIIISSTIFILGLISFLFSKDKISILKYSTLMSLVYILGGCSSSSMGGEVYTVIENQVVVVNYLDGLFEVLFYPYEDPYLYRIFLNIALCSLFTQLLYCLAASPRVIWNITTFKNKLNSITVLSCIAITYSFYIFYELNPNKYQLFIRTTPEQASIKLFDSSYTKEIPSDFKTGNIDTRADNGEFLFDENIYNVTINLEGYRERKIQFELDEDKHMNLRLRPIDKDGDLIPDIYDKCDSTKPRKQVNKRGCSQAQLKQRLLNFSNNSKINFGYDSSSIMEYYASYLDEMSSFLIENNKISILIEGHTSENEGDPEYCIALGERRARAVAQYLVNMGVDRNQLGTVSYGKEKPSFKNQTESSFSKNRRAYLVF
jgi:outer membrane protein OmpA-like peptidoglycan-associated protein